MAVEVTRLLRSCCHVCLLLSFSHAIGPTVSRDVKTKESPDVLPAASAATTLAHDVTRNAVLLRPTAAADDVIRTAAANATTRPRWRRKAEVESRGTSDDRSAATPEAAAAWSREVEARTLRELEQEIGDARTNCSRDSSVDVQSLDVELPARALRRFSAELASVVHAANVVALLLQSPAAAEMTSSNRD